MYLSYDIIITLKSHFFRKMFKFVIMYVVYGHHYIKLLNEPWHEISNNVVCATSKDSDQPAHIRSLIRAFAFCLNIL